MNNTRADNTGQALKDNRHPCSRFHWEALIRWLSLPGPRKAIAMTLATFATESTGKDVRPGEKLLIQASGYSERTVRKEMAELETTGLIRCVRRGKSTGKRNMTSEYELTATRELCKLASGEWVKFGGTPTRPWFVPEKYRQEMPILNEVPAGNAVSTGSTDQKYRQEVPKVPAGGAPYQALTNHKPIIDQSEGTGGVASAPPLDMEEKKGNNPSIGSDLANGLHSMEKNCAYRHCIRTATMAVRLTETATPDDYLYFCDHHGSESLSRLAKAG